MTIEEMAMQERREYMRKWRANNKERIKKHQSDYWKRKAEQRAKAEQQA